MLRGEAEMYKDLFVIENNFLGDNMNDSLVKKKFVDF
jgi:hypothetical protein